MELAPIDGGTRVSYNADVQVGGLIASVGQRMLGGVTRMMLDQFFNRMTEILTASKYLRRPMRARFWRLLLGLAVSMIFDAREKLTAYAWQE